MFNKFIKIVMVVVIFLVIAVLGYIGGSYVKHYLDIRKADKSVENFQNALEQPYKEDVYGGKTPEETWGMFLDALRRGDIELASKYYDIGHHRKANEWLGGLKENNKLEQSIKEMETFHKSNMESLENQANYAYYYFDEEFQQELSSPVIFYLNPHTKIWKIVW